MPDSIKVAHVVLTLDCGGLERIVLDLIREGRTLGQQVSVICLERPGALAGQVEALGSCVFCLHKRPGIRLDTIDRFESALRELRPDVLHTHQSGALFYAGPAARRAGVPILVHTEHGNHFQHDHAGVLARLRRSWLFWIAARHAARYFCVTQDIADELASRRIVPRCKLEVIPNGIDTDIFHRTGARGEIRQALGIASDAPVVGTVGRLNEVKRQDALIRAFARVRAQIPGAHLVLVGDGPMRDGLQTLAQDLKLDASVHFAGYQSHPERYLQAMDVFALTSRTEGMPLSILEAWAAGLPVLSSAVGGIPDLIDHGRNGLLFSAGDEVALTDLLADLIRDSQRARRLGEEGRREVVVRYSLRRMATDYQQHYWQLLVAKPWPAISPSHSGNRDGIGLAPLHPNLLQKK
jgi:sugar transferase (PEP-CTERM/EpsH1 system associated)